jgi:Ran GTPase-activating protein (RanGAP) involved in mRNA processing and transport
MPPGSSRRRKINGISEVMRERVEALPPKDPVRKAILNAEDGGNPKIALRNLNISGDDPRVTILLKYLTTNETVEHLDLSTNCMNDIEVESCKGIVQIANCLRSNKSLTKLDLSRNAIQLAGMAAQLADSLTVNCNLRWLNLEYNSIGRLWVYDDDEENNALPDFHEDKRGQYKYSTDGVSLLCTALKENQTLTWLDISDNYLFDEGANLMVEALDTCKLKFIDLSSNFISPENEERIAKTCASEIVGEGVNRHWSREIKLSMGKKPLVPDID